MKEIFEIEGKVYDFTPYQNLEDIHNYYGFIDPEGNFYRVRSKDDNDIDGPHNIWAKYYMQYKNLDRNEENLTSSQILIKKHHYVLSTYRRQYEEDVNIFLIPSKDGVFTSNLLNTELITKEQLHTVQLIDTPVSINEHRR